MNKPQCPYCSKLEKSSESRSRSRVVAYGSYYRKSDRKRISNFRCLGCKRYFGGAFRNACFRQNKRHLNLQIRNLYVSGVSLRRIAKLLKISRTTVSRKMVFLALKAKNRHEETNRKAPLASIVEFDELETFEHTKMKPVSVHLAVEYRTRRILDFEVASMGAKGLLSKKALKKYGQRLDERHLARQRLFQRLTKIVEPTAIFKSDQNPHYPESIKKYFPHATHLTTPGQRGAITGQGELKKIGFDPIFSLNHTCAMLRANMNRLFRKTWCTTKKRERLALHLAIYADYHNNVLIGKS